MSFPSVINSDIGSGLHRLEETTKTKPFGQRAVFPDGRRYAYAKAGAALIAGDLLQGVALVAGDDTDLVTAATAVGSKLITFTSATSTAANFYNEGWVHVNLASDPKAMGLYSAAKRNAHLVLTSGAGDIINLAAGETVRVALGSSDEIGLNKNEFDGVVVAPTTATNRHVGVTTTAIASGSYGFVQTFGVCAINVVGSTVVSSRVLGLTTTEGQVNPEAETAGIGSYVGDVMVVATTAAQLGLVFLRID